MPLELQSISRRYKERFALENVDLCVRDGDCYGLIGPNGAGKTTALRIALGLQRPDRGRVVVDGFDAAQHVREARARMGGLIEVPGFVGAWSGEQNLAWLARLSGLSRSEARREACAQLESVGLTHAGGRAVQGYSHGMRQRLGIAQALLGKPAYVLLDEPTNGLDPEGVVEMRALLARLVHDDGRTIVISSHQLHELSTLCNRIGLLRQGRLIVEQETALLLQSSSRRYRLESPQRARAAALLQSKEVEFTLAGDHTLELELGARGPDEILRELVFGGVPITAFAPRAQSLEEIYLRLASGERVLERAQAPDVRAQSTPAAVRTLTRPAASRAPGGNRAPAHPISSLLRYEATRLCARGAVPLLFLMPALVGGVAILRRAAQARADASAVSGAQVFSTTDVTAFESVGLALQAGLPLLGVLVLGLASQSIAAELARGTLRNLLLRPFERWQIAFGKALAALGAACSGYVLLCGVALCVSAALFDYGDVSEILPNGSRFTLTPAASLWPELWRALVAPILPLSAYAMLGLLAGAIARTGAGALALALGAGVLLDLSRALLRSFDLEHVVPSAYLPSPLGDTSFVRFYVDVSQGVSNAVFAHAGTAELVPAVWMLFALCGATLLLVRKPIQ